MSLLMDSDLSDYEPKIRIANNKRKHVRKSRMYHNLNNRPVIKKTVVFAEEEESTSSITEYSSSVKYSLNKNNRWNVISKPWLLRDDANNMDFRVVEHALTRKNKFLGTNADGIQIYTENMNNEKFLSTRANATTLTNLTELPRGKKNCSRKCNLVKEEPAEFPMSDFIQYDIYKVHTNLALIRNKKYKGNKRNSNSKNSFKKEIYEEMMDYYDERNEFDSVPIEYADCTVQPLSFISRMPQPVLDPVSLWPKEMKNNDVASIERAVVQSIYSSYFAKCKEPCVEVNAGHILPWLDYSWNKFTNNYVPQNAHKDLLPLWNYQLHIAKRDQQEVQLMQKSVEGHLRRMALSSWKYGKLAFSKDEIEIVRHYQYSKTFLVRILPRKNATKRWEQKTITNDALRTQNASLKYRYSDYHKTFSDFYQFRDIVVEENWNLSKLDIQLDPVAKYVGIRRTVHNREEEIDTVAYIKSELKKAIEKTVHLFPIAVSISSSTTDHFIHIHVRKNWKQRNQHVLYYRQIQIEQFYKPFQSAIQFTLLLDKNSI